MVSHAGTVLPAELADRIGLTAALYDATDGLQERCACPSQRLVIWDHGAFATFLQAQVGDFAVAAALGSLWGQVIEAETGQRASAATLAMSADCLSGAWTANLAAGHSPSGIRLSRGDLDEAVGGLLAGRVDLSPALSPTAFQRVAAFQHGFTNPVTACMSYMG